MVMKFTMQTSYTIVISVVRCGFTDTFKGVICFCSQIITYIEFDFIFIYFITFIYLCKSVICTHVFVPFQFMTQLKLVHSMCNHVLNVLLTDYKHIFTENYKFFRLNLLKYT